MQIIIDAAASTASVAGVARSVVYPVGYAALDKLTYDTETGVGLADATGNYTMGSILATSLLLWCEAAPTANDIWELIKAKRTEVNAGGVRASGDWYHTDPETLAQYSFMYAAIAVNALPGGYVFAPYWKTMAGDFRPMTANLLRVIVGRGMQSAALNFANAERHRVAMKATRSLYLYDYSTGWTETYA
jgi:hypothetical protein